jgi:hypothetical protein
MQVKELIDYYYLKFIPAYADAVASLGDKPVQLLVEQENTLAHLFAYLEDKNDEVNLKKAYGHLQRATLDCYKIIWIEYKEKLKFYISLDNSNLALAFNSKEGEVLEKIKKIDSLAKEARELESVNIGKNSTLALQKYIEVVELEKELLDSVDIKKVSSYNRFKLSHLLKDHSISIIIAIITGLISSYLWARFF